MHHLNKGLLQVPHDLLPDCSLHAEVPLDVLDVVLGQGLAVVHLGQQEQLQEQDRVQRNNSSENTSTKCNNNFGLTHSRCLESLCGDFLYIAVLVIGAVRRSRD